MRRDAVSPLRIIALGDGPGHIRIRIFGTPVSVLHDESARHSKCLVPDPERRAERRPVVAGGGLNIDVGEGSVRPDLSVRDAVHRASPSHAETGVVRPLPEPVQNVKRALLVNRLKRAGKILMMVREGLVLSSRRT